MHSSIRKIYQILEELNTYPILVSLFAGGIGGLLFIHQPLEGFVLFGLTTLIMYVVAIILFLFYNSKKYY